MSVDEHIECVTFKLKILNIRRSRELVKLNSDWRPTGSLNDSIHRQSMQSHQNVIGIRVS
jgi:hypothetical protein